MRQDCIFKEPFSQFRCLNGRMDCRSVSIKVYSRTSTWMYYSGKGNTSFKHCLFMDVLFRKRQCLNEVCRVKNLEISSFYNFLISPLCLYMWFAMTKRCVCYYLRVLTNEVGNAGSVSFPRAVFRFEHLTSRLIYWCTGCRRTRVRCRANTHSVRIDCLVRIDIAINLQIKLRYNISTAVCKSCRRGK